MVAKLPTGAFEFYVTLGPERSYQKVADHFVVSKRTVTKRAVQENWATRLLEAEAEARGRSEAKAVESLEAMNERHLKVARALQAKAVKALQELPLDSARDRPRCHHKTSSNAAGSVAVTVLLRRAQMNSPNASQ